MFSLCRNATQKIANAKQMLDQKVVRKKHIIERHQYKNAKDCIVYQLCTKFTNCPLLLLI